MPRVRIHFSKTGLACFISHTDLPMLFSRAARRGGLVPERTQGFSPHPKLALAPPLPVGVTGLCEPADFWFDAWGDVLFRAWSDKMPQGVAILRARVIEDPSSPSLAKLCAAASYRINSAAGGEAVARALDARLREDGAVLALSAEGDEAAIAVRDLERNGPSAMVRILKDAGLISGWSDLSVTRTAVGGWDETKRNITPV